MHRMYIYVKNYKSMMKEIKDLNQRRNISFMYRDIQYCYDAILLNFMCRFNTIPFKNPSRSLPLSLSIYMYRCIDT